MEARIGRVVQERAAREGDEDVGGAGALLVPHQTDGAIAFRRSRRGEGEENPRRRVLRGVASEPRLQSERVAVRAEMVDHVSDRQEARKSGEGPAPRRCAVAERSRGSLLIRPPGGTAGRPGPSPCQRIPGLLDPASSSKKAAGGLPRPR